MTIEEVIKRTDHIPSSVHPPEQEMWLDMISKLPGNPLIVDFGTGWGKSASSLGLSNPNSVVYTFDIGLVHMNASRSKEQYIQEVNDYITKSGATNVHFTLGSSLEVPWDKEIDVLNIDSDHLYETTKLEVNRWLPFVKAGGLVFLHDWDHPRCPGVRQAWDELVPSKFNLESLRITRAGEIQCAAFRKL